MKARLTVSDHAVLRYLERIGGFNIQRLKREIADRLQPAVDAGAGGIVIDGHSFVIEYGDQGPVVVTVLSATARPRNLMGHSRR